VALKTSTRQGRFSNNINGKYTLSYNLKDHDQFGQIVTEYDFQGPDPPPVVGPPPVPPVAIFEGNARPILLGNSAFRHGKQEQEFSPLVEFRTEVSYNLTQQFAVKLGFYATFIDNLRRASRHIDYTLPNMGFVDRGTQEILMGGVNFGCEFNR
jgi:hypothetical protein